MESLTVIERIARVRERMGKAALRRPEGWRSSPLRLLAATKGVSRERIEGAVRAGIDLIGENRIQEMVRKFSGAPPPVPCHFIGRLQRNKVAVALHWCDMIQSVDSIQLAEALHRRTVGLPDDETAAEEGRRTRILLQVNLAEEDSKGGFAPEHVEAAAEQISRWPGLAIEGLMAIPPYRESPEAARPYFTALRRLAERLATRQIEGVSMAILSMGMSHDFEVAIEEGATMVRLGSVLFGVRPESMG